MEKSKVYFTDMHTHNSISLPDKLKKLIKKAGIGTIDMEDKFVAIKIHFGEPGNLAFLRPNFAKAVADVVKEQKGLPFLTDCNTLYVGRRKHALEHIDAAYENGFSPFSTGCNVIIADGLKGTDEVDVPVVGGELVKEAKIGRAIMDADIFISLSHFKGHECHQEYRHGLRLQSRQNGTAQQRKAGNRSAALPGLRRLHQAVRAQRHLLRRQAQSQHRP